MVKSGLDQEIVAKGEAVRVSPCRLAAHLSSAFVLYVITLSAGMNILSRKSLFISGIASKEINCMRKWSHRLAGLTFATAVTGAFVAGLDAGLLYNTFPLMGGRILPSDIWDEQLALGNLIGNPTTVQFIHRCMAITTVAGVSVLWLRFRKGSLPKSVKRALDLLMAAAWAQGTLGVLTLLYMVPIPVASAHQAGSLGLLTSCVWLLNRLKHTLPK